MARSGTGSTFTVFLAMGLPSSWTRDTIGFQALTALFHLLVWRGQGEPNISLSVLAVAGARGHYNVGIFQQAGRKLGRGVAIGNPGPNI
jgi:hypothetical protein